MRNWLMAALAASLCGPLCAQGTPAPSSSNPDKKDPIAPFQDIDVGGVADGAYLPLALGRDRIGFGLRARLSFGWDSNIFKEDRDDDTALFGDGIADVYLGVDLGKIAVGVRGLLAGRLYFGEPDADQWDMKLGGFLKVPYGDGGLGLGLSADVLYQQLQTYEITGPITRQDDLRASGGIARVWIGYAFGIAVFEAGLHGQTDNFSEETTIPSYDNWETGIDLSMYLKLGPFELKPWVDFSYEWFRDQLDRDELGTVLTDEDSLQLLKFQYGVDFAADLAVFELQGRAYALRQDDSASGFDRYWQYGVKAAADFNIAIVRLTVGTHLWHREFEDRPDFDSTGAPSTTFERYAQFWGEVSIGFFGPLHAGVRYVYTRRTSDIDTGGYAAHEISIFVELSF